MTVSRRDFLRVSAYAAMAPGLSGIARSSTDAGALCRKLRADAMRPQFHLLPASNWMNDPNGPIYYRGRYHMFFQYNPNAAVWGDMHWAHASSVDMIHWRHEPVAMAPTPKGFDQFGVFSGSAVLDGDTPTMIYTGVMPPASEKEVTLSDEQHKWREVQCLATSHDRDLRTWQKLAEPVIATPPPGLEITGFRDPYVWREGNSWMLILGSGARGKSGMVLLYRSTDLRHWTYLHPLVEGSGLEEGDMWECPDFFPLGGKHVLLLSTKGKTHWKVGTYRDQRFFPEKEGLTDWGAFYAAKTMPDRDGNRILWGWIPETRPESEHSAAGWAGVMSLPRVCTLNDAQELEMEVVPAVRNLRKRNHHAPMNEVRREPSLGSLRIHDLSAELQLECRPKGDAFTINLESETGNNFATISCTNRSGKRELQVNEVKAAFPGGERELIKLHFFLDGSVLEVFANGTTVITARVYQVPSTPLRLVLKGDAELISAQLWQMEPSSKDRLTGSLCG